MFLCLLLVIFFAPFATDVFTPFAAKTAKTGKLQMQLSFIFW
jgi:hypothetical protein